MFSRRTFNLSQILPRIAYALGEASNGLNLLLLAIMARYLGVEQYGSLMAVMSVGGILGEINEFGFPTLVTRSVANERGSAWTELKRAILKQAWMCLPMLFLLYGYMLISKIPASLYLPSLLIGASIGFRSLKSTMRGVCRGLEQFQVETLFLWTERGALLLFGILCLTSGGGFNAIGVVFFIVRGLDLIVFFWVLKKRIFANPSIPPSNPITLAAALPFAIGGLLWSLYYQVDIALLSVLSTSFDTGIYGALYRFVDILAVIPRLVMVVAFPAMSVAWSSNRSHFQETFQSLQRLLTSISIPVLFVLILWTKPILTLAFGEQYVSGTFALRLLLLGTFFTFQSMFMHQALSASRNEKKLAYGLAISAGFNVIINLILIPKYGFLGASIATFTTEFFYFIALCILARLTGTVRGFPVRLLEISGISLLTILALFAPGR